MWLPSLLVICLLYASSATCLDLWAGVRRLSDALATVNMSQVDVVLGPQLAILPVEMPAWLSGLLDTGATGLPTTSTTPPSAPVAGSTADRRLATFPRSPAVTVATTKRSGQTAFTGSKTSALSTALGPPPADDVSIGRALSSFMAEIFAGLTNLTGSPFTHVDAQHQTAGAATGANNTDTNAAENETSASLHGLLTYAAAERRGLREVCVQYMQQATHSALVQAVQHHSVRSLRTWAHLVCFSTTVTLSAASKIVVMTGMPSQNDHLLDVLMSCALKMIILWATRRALAAISFLTSPVSVVRFVLGFMVPRRFFKARTD